jgi:hypothetical protein
MGNCRENRFSHTAEFAHFGYGPASGRVPETMGNKQVSVTESCVAVACRSEHDGPTQINLAQSHEVTPVDQLIFDGDISTRSKTLSICSILNDEVLSAEVTGTITHLRVFANDPTEPDRIFVVFDR